MGIFASAPYDQNPDRQLESVKVDRIFTDKASGKLVAANTWIEVSTLLSILFGLGLGSFLMTPSTLLPQIAGTPVSNASALIASVYLIAGLCAAAIPKSKISNPAALTSIHTLLHDFRRSFVILGRDPDARISLAVTTLFWAVSATLQFIILRWGAQTLQLPLAQAALLQAGVALGMVVGALAAARWIPLRRAQKVLPLGIAIGASVLGLTGVTQLWIPVVLLLITGALAGLLVVPMNALLQHRGQLLMHSGQSIAVQNFNESLASLVLLAVYGLLLYVDAPLADHYRARSFRIADDVVDYGALLGQPRFASFWYQRQHRRSGQRDLK